MKIEAAERLRLAFDRVGLTEANPESQREKLDNPPAVPTLAEFAPRFREHIKLRSAEKPETIRFYNSKLDRLLEYKPLADANLDAINDEMIEDYTTHRVNKKLSPATVNRELATLRRLLRFTMNKRGIIKSVPSIEMLDGERQKDSVLSREQEANYLASAAGHLRDAVLLAIETGLRVSELVALRWEGVRLEPVGNAKYGNVFVRSGKTKHARRYVPLTSRATKMLESKLRIGSRVFSISANTLQHHHQALRDKLGFDPDFTIHSLRHTMLTRSGESGADAFTIKKIAGHSSITISE